MMNLISRPPDNHKFLRISSMLELLLQLLKVSASSYPALFYMDISDGQKDIKSSAQVIIQLAIANALQILTNLISFLGFWSTKGTIVQDEQFVVQTKNEMFKNEFLLCITSTNYFHSLLPNLKLTYHPLQHF